MNLNQFYVSQSSSVTTAAMKVPPRRNLIPLEVPLMSCIHLRHQDIFADSSSFSSMSSTKIRHHHHHPAPYQSILTIFAINAAKAQSKISRSMMANDGKEENDDNGATSTTSLSSSSLCPHHSDLEPEEKEELIPEEYQRRVRSIVGFIPLLKKSKEVPPSPSPHLYSPASKSSSNMFPPSSSTAANNNNNTGKGSSSCWSSSGHQNYFRQPTQEEFMEHWNNTIGRSFLRNSASAVPMLPEVWVVVPFDTIVERYLAMLDRSDIDDVGKKHNKNGDDADDSSLLEEDFVSLALQRSSALRQRVTSHLVGQLRELPVSAVAISCKIVVNVLQADVDKHETTNNKKSSYSSSTSIPKIVKDIEIEHEYYSVKRWLSGCTLEIAASCETGEMYWIYGSPHPSLGIVSSLAELNAIQKAMNDDDDDVRRRGSGENSNTNPNNNDDASEVAAESGKQTKKKQPATTRKVSGKRRQRNTDDDEAAADLAATQRDEDNAANLSPPKQEDEEEADAKIKQEEDREDVTTSNEQHPLFINLGEFSPSDDLLINPLLFNPQHSSPVSNCNHCQDELLDRLTYKHTTINLTRIVIPTLLSYGLNVKWIDDDNAKLFFLNQVMRYEATSDQTYCREKKRKLLVMSSALRALKQAFVLCSCSNNNDDCVVKKSESDEDNNSFKKEEEGDVTVIDNTNGRRYTASFKTEGEKKRLDIECIIATENQSKKWKLTMEGEDPIIVSPYKFRVNIDEMNLKMKVIFIITNKDSEDKETTLVIEDIVR